MFRALLFLLLVICSIGCSSSRKINSDTQAKTKESRQHTFKKTEKAQSVVSLAESQIGARYSYGGNGPKAYDCSGLVQSVYGKVGIQLPRRSSDIANRGEKIGLKNVRIADLIFFTHGTRINHVAIVTAVDNRGIRMVHSTSSKGVIQEYLEESTYWRSRVKLVRRVMSE